ncbi:arsenate reductase ArsC [Rubrivivax sp. RP6-9]|uniref:arsenate reductase ArsC n=1 Tax=Rubrivivax sp. RP6-9 TaxID=3415750 RepID=UPI003CC6A040
MSDKVYNVLFICTHNSARSIIAEALLNSAGRGGFVAYSAGSQPRGEVHPQALATLARLRLPTDGYRSKSWSEFATADAPQMDFVFTVCDNAAGEVCPVWPGQPMTAHWGVPDPSAAPGDETQRAQAFWDVATVLKRRIDLMLALPLAALDRLAIQREVREIGSR